MVLWELDIILCAQDLKRQQGHHASSCPALFSNIRNANSSQGSIFPLFYFYDETENVIRSVWTPKHQNQPTKSDTDGPGDSLTRMGGGEGRSAYICSVDVYLQRLPDSNLAISRNFQPTFLRHLKESLKRPSPV